MKKGTNVQRGAGLVVAFLFLLGVGAGSLILKDSAVYFEQVQKEREQRSNKVVQEARQALLYYLLLRAESDLNIAQGTTAIPPRWLMFPCPDNVTDENLDGSQEGSCGAKGSATKDVVNDILNSGSRFGRLPWRTSNVNAVHNSINDGIDLDLLDSGNSRLWYALSRNIAPGHRLPLNFHRLMTYSDEWLQVVDHEGEVVSDRVAAVILAPGATRQIRVPEQTVLTAVLNYNQDVKVSTGLLAPARYFESYQTPKGEFFNYNKDGKFIRAPAIDGGFNDVLSYVAIEELIKSGQYFVDTYSQLIGTTKIHNAPGRDRPLFQIASALNAYYAMFGFYPGAAAQTVVAHQNQRQRHCAQYHSGDEEYTVTLPINTTLALAAATNVFVANSTLPATVTLTTSAHFLLQQHTTVSGTVMTAVVYNDATISATELTLARYARVNLDKATLLVLEGDLQAVSLTVQRLAAAAQVLLLSAIEVTISAALLKPQGDMQGWLAAHAAADQRAGDDGSIFNLPAATRAMFLSPTELTSALQTLQLTSGDLLTLAAGSAVRFEEDVEMRQPLTATIFYQQGGTELLDGLLPTEPSYRQRQFIVWLLADAIRGTTTIKAPAVLFPWRAKEGNGDAVTRDNLHDYPPCLDTRNFFDRRFRLAVEDQMMVYAVSEQCHYGGDPAACGRGGGFTVSVVAGATVALPQAVVLTQSYTVTVGNILTVTLLNGMVQDADITVSRLLTFPVLDAAQRTIAAFRLTAGTRLAASATVKISAGTPLLGGEQTVFEQVQALLIYSAAPLPRVACARGMTMALAGTVALSPPVVLADQRTAAEDIQHFCYWLDDEENADGDGHFTIYAGEQRRGISPRNDYFILFGGQLRIGDTP